MYIWKYIRVIYRFQLKGKRYKHLANLKFEKKHLVDSFAIIEQELGILK